jgi:hypothetical protein
VVPIEIGSSNRAAIAGLSRQRSRQNPGIECAVPLSGEQPDPHSGRHGNIWNPIAIEISDDHEAGSNVVPGKIDSAELEGAIAISKANGKSPCTLEHQIDVAIAIQIGRYERD